MSHARNLAHALKVITWKQITIFCFLNEDHKEYHYECHMKKKKKRLTVWEMKIFPVEFIASNRSLFNLLPLSSLFRGGRRRKQTNENIRGVTTCKHEFLFTNPKHFLQKITWINYRHETYIKLHWTSEYIMGS